MNNANNSVKKSVDVEEAVNNFLQTLASTTTTPEAISTLDHLSAFMQANPTMFRKLFSESTIGKIQSLSKGNKKPSLMDMAGLAMELVGDLK